MTHGVKAQLLIGFSGGMGSGKSTAIEALKAQNKGPVALVKFAQPLYDIQEFIYRRIAPVYSRPEDFVKDRKLLQWLGTEWGRDSISQTLWVDLWKARVAHIRGTDPNVIVVCDDVRFENEAQTLQSLGGYVIRIDAPAAKDRISTANGLSNHKSETALPEELVDFKIQNDGSLDEYKAAVCQLIDQIRADLAA